MPELNEKKPMPAGNVLPKIGGDSAKSPDQVWVDPNLTPEALGKKTSWKVVLNEEDGDFTGVAGFEDVL
jgi:hypothetical protein